MPTNTLLLIASALLLSTTIMPFFTSKWPLWARAVLRLAVFTVLCVLLVNSLGSPFSPVMSVDRPDLRIWEQAIEIGWWTIAAQCAVSITRLFLVFEAKPRETRIVSDLSAGMIHLLAFFAIINFVFSVPIGGLLATSGVIAIVLGLALQSSLSDLFSGVAVGIERPYTAGDLVSVEGGVEGRVVQVNWRSTHIATANHDVAIVPNSVMAKSRLVNHSIPTTTRGMSIAVQLASEERPDRCLATITAALRSCMLILDAPSPSIARTELKGDGVTYEVSFSVPNIGSFAPARTELLGQIQSHLKHAGLALAITGIPKPESPQKSTAVTLLKESDWFGVLKEEDQAFLAGHFAETRYEPGDRLVHEGQEPSALFILAAGAVEISISNGGDKRIIRKLGPGASLGAIAMIMDSSYGATATALTSVSAYCLDRKGLKEAITARPDLVQSLEAMAHRGQDGQSADTLAHPNAQLQTPEMFFPRLKEFLRRISETQHL